MTYAEKLKDPRWQKKRLKILNRDNWTCQLCKSTERTLHVHHNEYSGEPWEADAKELITYCHLCHKVIEFFRSREIKRCPFKVIVHDEQIIIALVRGIKFNHCWIFDFFSDEFSFRTAISIEWMQEVIDSFK